MHYSSSTIHNVLIYVHFKESMPEPLKCQDHLRELESLLTETSFRQQLRNSVNVSLNFEDMKNAKVELMDEWIL